MKMNLQAVLSPIVALACLFGVGRAEEGEKLLFGFEREEVEAIAQKEKNKERIAKFDGDGDFQFFMERSQGANHELEVRAIRPMNCVREQASAGTYSCKVREVFEEDSGHNPSFRLPTYRLWTLHESEPRANLRVPEIFNTSGWFDWAIPRDWSGYDLLRVDVRIETIEQVDKLMLEVEDQWVEPPVSLTFDQPPGGKWVTLEMDLGRAVEERKLDLSHIVNVWVRVKLKDLEGSTRRIYELQKDSSAGAKEELEKMRFLAYVDNLRLATKKTPSAHQILNGVRSQYTEKLPRSYGVEEHMLKDTYPARPVVPAEFQPAGGEGKMAINLWYRPVVVPADAALPKAPEPESRKALTGPSAAGPAPLGDMIVKGCLDTNADNAKVYNSVRLSCVAASDPDHIIVGFYVFRVESLRAGPTAQMPLARLCSAAIATTDDGRTWKGLDGADWPTVMGGNISKVPPRLVDLGEHIGGAYRFGCTGLGGAHLGYPAEGMFFVRSARTANGYLKSPKYFISGDPRHCHSVGSGDLAPDPSGRIWGTWGGKDRFSYGSVVSHDSTWVYWSDDGGVTWCSWRGPGLNGAIPFVSNRSVRIVPYRGHAAVIGMKGWTAFDGKAWSEPEKVGVNIHDAVSCGEEIYASDATGPVKVYDGTAWKEFSVPGRQGQRGKVGVCGWKLPVFVETDASGKKLLLWRKRDGAWQGPVEIASEETPILQFAVQRYAPSDFFPVAYMCASDAAPSKSSKSKYDDIYGFCQDPPAGTVHQPWVKVLKVPAE